MKSIYFFFVFYTLEVLSFYNNIINTSINNNIYIHITYYTYTFLIMFPIENIDKTTVQTGVNFSVEIVDMVFNQSAKFRVFLHDENKNIIDVNEISIDGTDYASWNNDDNYIIHFIANKLGFTLKE